MSTADMTRCAVCGGEFSARRVHIDGKQFHERCAVMSYPPHTHDDAARMSAEIGRLRGALLEAAEKVESLAPDETGYITEYGLEEQIAEWKRIADGQSVKTEEHNGC